MSVPRATYRLQMNSAFTIAHAREIVEYLHALGVSHLYLSPILKARPGSTHGYDVVDPRLLNPELGTEQDLSALHRDLEARDMSIVLDIVPNHMSASLDNPWWSDVLEQGTASRFAPFFDIEWSTRSPLWADERKVLIPILGRRQREVLESRELKLTFGERGFRLSYYDHAFPIALDSYAAIRDACDLPASFRAAIPHADPDRVNRDPSERRSEKRAVDERLWKLYQNPRVRAKVDACLAVINEGEEPPELLETLLQEQAYRLVYWRRASGEINYRRFFDVSDLVGVRVELDEVFELTHDRVLEWVERGYLDGLRIDHIDGLRTPVAYLRRLRSEAAALRGEEPWIVVEKILAPDERLPEDFAAEGTTGYDFLNAAGAALVHQRGTSRLVREYARFTGLSRTFPDVAYEKKKQAIATLFLGDLRALGAMFVELAAVDPRVRSGSSQRELVEVILEVSACLPVYRTYISSRDHVSDDDRAYITAAVAEARRRAPLDRAAYAFLERVLLLSPATIDEENALDRWLEFVMRWQQFTGPATAKGVEDTTFYVYHPLLSLNEVGGEVSVDEISLDRFHELNAARAERWPSSMNTTSTHDTKRGEDARARMSVISEIADEWTDQVVKWSKMNAKLRKGDAPSRNEEWMIYQALAGVWPLDRAEERTLGARLSAYLSKALREGKENSNWHEPDEEYEKRVIGFAKSILSKSHRFRAQFERFHERIAFHGMLNSLALVIMKMASPGVPDFYQGTELWDFSLVDPDNRRPVDYAKRARLLRQVERLDSANLLSRWTDGRIKMLLTQRGLRARREHEELFTSGSYERLDATGKFRTNVIAFERAAGDRSLLAIAPRLTTTLVAAGEMPVGEIWKDTAVPSPSGGTWSDLLTGQTVTASRGKLRLREVLSELPVAMLVRQ